MMALCTTQIVLSIIGLISQIAGSSMKIYPNADLLWAGIWCGIMVEGSAIFGMLASVKPSHKTFILNLVFAIISAISCIPVLVISSVGMSYLSHCQYDRSYNDIRCNGFEQRRCILGIQIIISLVQATVSIILAGMTCGAVCSCCRSAGRTEPMYYLINAPDGAIYSQRSTVLTSQPGYATYTINQRQLEDVDTCGLSNEIPNCGTCVDAMNSYPPRYDTICN